MNNLFKILSISTACVSGVFAAASFDVSPNGGRTPPESFKLGNPIRPMMGDLGKKGDARVAPKSVASDLDDDMCSLASGVSGATASVGVSRHQLVQYLLEGFVSPKGLLSLEKFDYLVAWLKTVYSQQSSVIQGLRAKADFGRDLKDINQVASFQEIAFLYNFFLQDSSLDKQTTEIFGKFFLDALRNKNLTEIRAAAFDKLEALMPQKSGLSKCFQELVVPTKYEAIRGLQTRVYFAPAEKPEKIARERIEAELGGADTTLLGLMQTSLAQAQAAESRRIAREEFIAAEAELRGKITEAFDESIRDTQSVSENLKRKHELEKARNDAVKRQQIFEGALTAVADEEASGRTSFEGEDEALRTEMMLAHQTDIFALRRSQLMKQEADVRGRMSSEAFAAYPDLQEALRVSHQAAQIVEENRVTDEQIRLASERAQAFYATGLDSTYIPTHEELKSEARALLFSTELYVREAMELQESAAHIQLIQRYFDWLDTAPEVAAGVLRNADARITTTVAAFSQRELTGATQALHSRQLKDFTRNIENSLRDYMQGMNVALAIISDMPGVSFHQKMQTLIELEEAHRYMVEAAAQGRDILEAEERIRRDVFPELRREYKNDLAALAKSMREGLKSLFRRK